MTLISVVLPTYNGSKYIARAIDSIINQTEADWELIIVNDCSTDNTLEIISNYANRDKRIKIINNSQNMKLPASLNIGFKQATGKYLTWTSDDNMYKPNAFSVMSEFLKKHDDVDFVSCDMDWVDEKLEFLHLHSNEADRTSPLTLAYYCNIGACFMYRNTIFTKIGKYNEELFCAEDYDYWCRIALSCNMYYLSDNCYKYVTNTEGLTYTHKQKALDTNKIVVKQYSDAIIEKYSKNIIDKVITYSRLKNKYKDIIKLPLAIAIMKKIFFDLPFFIMRFFPNKQIRHRFRDFMNGVKSPEMSVVPESNPSI